MSATEQITETGNEYDNLVRLLHGALEGAETCKGYVLEAEGVGNYQLADFFAEVQSGPKECSAIEGPRCA